MNAQISYTEEDRQEITATLKQAAVALATYWDALRHAEVCSSTQTETVEIDTDYELLSNLAAELSFPPAPSQLGDDVVWESFTDAVSVKKYPVGAL